MPSLLMAAHPGRSLLRGLVSHWPLAFPAGGVVDLKDYRNGNTLTDNTTVTTAAGPSAKLARATQFTRANSQYLSIATNASLETGSIDFSLSVFAYMDSAPAGDSVLVSKYGAPNIEFVLFWQQSTNQFRFEVSNDGTAVTGLNATTFGSPSLATWYYITAWHDAGNDQLGIDVNDIENTAAYTLGGFVGASAFQIGGIGAAANWDGRLAAVTFHKRVPTAQERTYLYNGGSGRQFSYSRGFF